MWHVPGVDRTERRRFVHHYLQMVLAMFVGMFVGGALIGGVFGQREFLREHPGILAPVMATNMTIGMVVWMRYRGHGWAATADMAAAMYVPTFLFLIPYLAGVIAKGPMLAGMHLLMLPAMWAVMLRRRDEYTHDHHAMVQPLVPAQ